MKKEKKKIVLVFGTFDILHAGHIHFFKQAKQWGNYLTVVVARDNRAKEVKRALPLHTERERLEFLKHITLIDRAVLGSRTDIYQCIRDIRPDVIALGYDQRVFVNGIEQVLQEIGLPAKVIRLGAYFPARCKTKVIRSRLNM